MKEGSEQEINEREKSFLSKEKKNLRRILKIGLEKQTKKEENDHISQNKRANYA